MVVLRSSVPPRRELPSSSHISTKPSVSDTGSPARECMTTRSRPIIFAAFALVVAPIGAAAIVSALLLLGVPPRLVFAPGFALLAWLARLGLHAPNAVGVLTTVALWWVAIVAAGVLWDRRCRRAA